MAFHGKPVTLTLTPSGSGATDLLTGLAVKEIGDLSVSVTTIDTTAHGSGNWKTFIGGLAEAGELSLSVDYSTKATTEALFTNLGETCTAVFTIPHGTATDTVTISVVITGVGISMAIDDVVRTPITLKPSGAPTFATS